MVFFRDSVTHIVTGYDTVEKVLPVIKRYMCMYELVPEKCSYPSSGL